MCPSTPDIPLGATSPQQPGHTPHNPSNKFLRPPPHSKPYSSHPRGIPYSRMGFPETSGWLRTRLRTLRTSSIRARSLESRTKRSPWAEL